MNSNEREYDWLIDWLDCAFNTPYQQAMERLERERDNQLIVIYCTYSFVYWSPIMECRGMIMRQDYTINQTTHSCSTNPIELPCTGLSLHPPPPELCDSMIIYFTYQISNIKPRCVLISMYQTNPTNKQFLKRLIYYMGHSWQRDILRLPAWSYHCLRNH